MNEDMILPEGFETDLPESEGVNETGEVDETTVNPEASPSAQEETVQEEQPEELTGEETGEETEGEQKEELPPIKVKYNKEEIEIPYEEAVPLIQKGLNYDKIQERLQALESDPRLSFVEELAQEQGMDVNEFIEAYKKWREQEQLNQLIQQNIPEELAQEILETRKLRAQIEEERKVKEQQEKENEEFANFFDYFREANGRDFDASKDQIPQEVWEANANGVPLKYAYMEYLNNKLKNQVQVLKQNEENAKKAPVTSVSAHGSQEIASEDAFLRGFNSI